jgi:DNA-binding NarL/FixJ family response regulator
MMVVGQQSESASMTAEGKTIAVLIVDDHPLIREGLAAVIDGHSDINLVGEATNGREAIEQYRNLRPDVTLMDLRMPEMNGIDAIIAIRAEFPDARIAVLTTYRGDVHALRAIKAGALGYLLKSMLRKELIGTIRALAAGQRHIPAEIAAELAEHIGDEVLSARELQVLQRVAQGNANKEVATQLLISEDTVKTHMKSILAKLGAHDRTHAVTIALKRGIIDV